MGSIDFGLILGKRQVEGCKAKEERKLKEEAFNAKVGPAEIDPLQR